MATVGGRGLYMICEGRCGFAVVGEDAGSDTWRGVETKAQKSLVML